MTSIPQITEPIVREKYNELYKVCGTYCNESDKNLIAKAFNFAYEAHRDIERKSGEPFIIHPLEVAEIVANEMGLEANAIAAALLHDVVEDTEYTAEDIQAAFGEKIATIVQGLTKVTRVFQTHHSVQAENFRRMIQTLSEDVMVMLIKLADRLHNMRTLQSLPKNKQLKIAGESIYLFAPIAYQLGLYTIKRELEDLSLKHRYPKIYEEIKHKAANQEKTRQHYIQNFIAPVQTRLKDENYTYTIQREPRSIYNIWYQMHHHGLTFEEAYDLLIITIVFTPHKEFMEKAQCWNIYSLISDIYMPKPDKIHDYVTRPRVNGYEALHATFMGPDGKWVEVRIRSDRMQEIAKRGFAASLKYKNQETKDSELNTWINKVRELLEAPSEDPSEFLDDFRLNLFSSEILVFTPKGGIITLPQKATALDFAYEIHTEIGNKAIGAKINHKLVPLNQQLQSGDQVEILTSENKQSNNQEWIDQVITSKAKTNIKKLIKSDVKKTAHKGELLLKNKLDELNIPVNEDLYHKLLNTYNLHFKEELFNKIGDGSITLDNLQQELRKKNKNKWIRYWGLQIPKSKFKKKSNTQAIIQKKVENKKRMILDDSNPENTPPYEIANCCRPIPGDEVIGYIIHDQKVIIHKNNCPKAIRAMSQEGDKIVDVQWETHQYLSFLVKIRIKGIDRFGIYNQITTTISKQLDINIRAINLDSYDGIFEGTLEVYMHHTKDLNHLIENLFRIKGVESVSRIELT